ncbi:MAG: hypothetical protein KDA24_11635 [Deltaproteobacteria bacterium]|nr:hypothetical protein [Deltaproteobacteria bacterium]
MTAVRLSFAILALFGAMLFSGCSGNDCQQLCKEIADYWDDCGISYGDAEVAECRKSFGSTGDSKEQYENYERSCRQLMAPMENTDGDRVPAIRARFSCTDMEAGPGGAFGG